MKNTPNRPIDYVSNREMYETIVDYKIRYAAAEAAGTTVPQIPDKVALGIMQIASRYSKKKNFVGYSYRDEMEADGIRDCILYFNTFDPARTQNPFAFFTQVIHNAFIRRIQKEKRQQYIKYKSMYRTRGADLDYLDKVDTKVQDEFIAKYEEAIQVKKDRKSKKDEESPF